jgi:hypothetical protein
MKRELMILLLAVAVCAAQDRKDWCYVDGNNPLPKACETTQCVCTDGKLVPTQEKAALKPVPVHHPNQYVFVGVKWTGTAAISDTVAVCNVDDKGKPHNCKLENGHTLDDLVEIVIETAEQSQPAK